MKKKFFLVLAISFAIAGYSFFKSSNTSYDIILDNIESLTTGDYPLAGKGWSYVPMFQTVNEGYGGIYMDQSTCGTTTEEPYQMIDKDGHIAYKCCSYRKPVNSTEVGHCFEYTSSFW